MKHQVMSPFLFSLSLCWKTPWRIICRGVTYPLLKWTGLEHASHSLSTMPNSYFRQRIGRAIFPVEFAVGNWGDWMYASNPLVPTFLSPYSVWWTLSWGLFIPMEIWSQNHLGWKRLPEVTWPHLVNLTRDSNINSPRTKLFVNNSRIPHRPPLHSKSVFSFVLQWNRLLNCSFCCGVCMPVHTRL